MFDLGVDIGNFQVKTSENIIFESKVTTTKSYGTNADTLKYNNVLYYLGEGEEEIGYKKFEKENFFPLLLGAICKSTTENDIRLGIGLPVNQFAQFKNNLVEMLQGETFKVEYNGTKRNIIIDSVKVYPEGVTGYLYFAKNILDKISNRDIVLIDIGGKTTDIALIKGNRATKPYSMDKGTIDIYDAIAKSIETDPRFEGEVRIEERNKVQEYLDRGFFFKGEKQNIKSNIEASKDIFKNIYNELKLNYPITTEAVVLMGGGAKILGSAFKNSIPGIIVMDNLNEDIFANANGYKKMLSKQ